MPPKTALHADPLEQLRSFAAFHKLEMLSDDATKACSINSAMAASATDFTAWLSDNVDVDSGKFKKDQKQTDVALLKRKVNSSLVPCKTNSEGELVRLEPNPTQTPKQLKPFDADDQKFAAMLSSSRHMPAAVQRVTQTGEGGASGSVLYFAQTGDSIDSSSHSANSAAATSGAKPTNASSVSLTPGHIQLLTNFSTNTVEAIHGMAKVFDAALQDIEKRRKGISIAARRSRYEVNNVASADLNSFQGPKFPALSTHGGASLSILASQYNMFAAKRKALSDANSPEWVLISLQMAEQLGSVRHAFPDAMQVVIAEFIMWHAQPLLEEWAGHKSVNGKFKDACFAISGAIGSLHTNMKEFVMGEDGKPGRKTVCLNIVRTLVANLKLPDRIVAVMASDETTAAPIPCDCKLFEGMVLQQAKILASPSDFKPCLANSTLMVGDGSVDSLTMAAPSTAVSALYLSYFRGVPLDNLWVAMNSAASTKQQLKKHNGMCPSEEAQRAVGKWAAAH